ncbi:photosystem II protein Psb27 [Prochlorococcus sp. MIT 1300]|uniref:photosystem II protein Psb27 n=1 Tax=Prochlorococcus sp. MIT 1300 TaxID=3096218 RepID=UPI002A75FAC5|nr:photosystem II protein Psb27 [Prochlorococcus sp. MIT 1300]
MKLAFDGLVKRLMRLTFTLLLGSCILLTSFVSTAEARRSSISGDYVKDTVAVIHSLEETIALPQDSESHSTAEKEALVLITDYMSTYRSRRDVGGLQSFTTMQTALNSLAGHYKNYSNRPLPENLTERLNKELAKAEKTVLRGS